MPAVDPNKSKIKMVALTSGKNKNITWYSFLNKDHRSSQKIVQKMLTGFNAWLEKHPGKRQTINAIIFYEQGIKIAEAKP